LLRLVLSDDLRQRRYINRFLVGALNCAAGLVALNYGVTLGLVEAPVAHWMTALGSLATVVLYACLRSGWNRRLAAPAMTDVQIMVVIPFLAAGYYFGGLGRTVALMLLFLILMFGMFVSQPRQFRWNCVVAWLALTVSLGATAYHQRAEPYLLELTAVYYLVMVIILGSLSYLASEQAVMRARLVSQKEALREALRRIGELASRDELTGLVNRRQMGQLLSTEELRSQRSGRPMSLCLIDLDHFKAVNDRFGHAVGDEVLQGMAKAVLPCLRGSDVLARWGGEEFLLLFPDTARAEAAAVVERVRLQLSQAQVSALQPALRITLSAGLTDHLGGGGEPWSGALDRADDAMYEAKRLGRNQVMVLPPLPPLADGEAGASQAGLPFSKGSKPP